MVLLSLWSLALYILSFAIKRVGIDDIGRRKDKGGERIACNDRKRCRR
jgi:hypothetical protein